MITMPILTRLLSPEAYGVTALVGTVISLVSVFALAGIDMSYARAYYSAKPPNGSLVEHYCWRFALTTSATAAALAGIVWWIIHRHDLSLNPWWSIPLAAGIVLSVANAMALTRARLAGRYRAMAAATLASGALSALTGVAIALRWRQDAVALVLPMLIGYLGPVILLGTPPLAQLSRASELPRNKRTALLKIGLAGVITAPMYWVLSSLDRWFLDHYFGVETVGIYSIACSVGLMGTMFNSAVISVWFPEASREYEKDPVQAQAVLGRLLSRLVAAMGVIWLMVNAAGGDIIRWLANERFHASAAYVPYIAGGVFFYGVSQLAQTGLLLAKRLFWAACWWFVGGLLCALLNQLLVPKFGGGGAAATQAISFAAISIGILARSQAAFSVRLEYGRLGLTLMVLAVGGLCMAPPWDHSPIRSLALKMPIGSLLAFSAAWFNAPDWCISAIHTIRRKLKP